MTRCPTSRAAEREIEAVCPSRSWQLKAIRPHSLWFFLASADAGDGSSRPQFRLPGGWKMPAIELLIFPLPGGELVSICPTYPLPRTTVLP